MHLERESCCRELVQLLRANDAVAVVHLAFVSDPRHTSFASQRQMWQVNVAGTARVMEAIAEVNRHGGNVQRFVYLGSAAVYGPETKPLVDEEASLGASTLMYAMQKAEADGVVRFRAGSMGKCETYLLRPHIFAGAPVENYLMDIVRGQKSGTGRLARIMRRKGIRAPLLLPTGELSPRKLFQFVHIDDVTRLVAWLLQKAPPQREKLLTLNVAGSGAPISIGKCAEIAGERMVQLPWGWMCMKLLSLLWSWRATAVPPDALPYMSGSYTTSTDRLRRLLGSDYSEVIRYSSEAALRDSFEAMEGSQTGLEYANKINAG
jgi:nucleoside-diphosphate-sugar epimerase